MHRLALAEFRRSARWYAERSEKVARQFLEAVLDTVDSIESDPLRFASYDDPIARRRFKDFRSSSSFRIQRKTKPSSSRSLTRVAGPGTGNAASSLRRAS